MKAGRFFPGITQLVVFTLALATKASGEVDMTIAEIMRRTHFGRGVLLRSVRALVGDGILLRDSQVSWHFTWNAARVAELAALVSEEDKQAAVNSAESSFCRAVADIVAVYREAERETAREFARRRGLHARVALSAAPKEEGLNFLREWTPAFAATVNADDRSVAFGSWRVFRTIPSNRAGNVSYVEAGHPFAFLPWEIQRNAEFESKLRRRFGVGSEPRQALRSSAPISSTVVGFAGAREALAAVGGAS
jgi:hypothetical protein